MSFFSAVPKPHQPLKMEVLAGSHPSRVSNAPSGPLNPWAELLLGWARCEGTGRAKPHPGPMPWPWGANTPHSLWSVAWPVEGSKSIT